MRHDPDEGATLVHDRDSPDLLVGHAAHHVVDRGVEVVPSVTQAGSFVMMSWIFIVPPKVSCVLAAQVPYGGNGYAGRVAPGLLSADGPSSFAP